MRRYFAIFTKQRKKVDVGSSVSIRKCLCWLLQMFFLHMPKQLLVLKQNTAVYPVAELMAQVVYLYLAKHRLGQ